MAKVTKKKAPKKEPVLMALKGGDKKEVPAEKVERMLSMGYEIVDNS